jgi:hypothetical protein
MKFARTLGYKRKRILLEEYSEATYSEGAQNNLYIIYDLYVGRIKCIIVFRH